MTNEELDKLEAAISRAEGNPALVTHISDRKIIHAAARAHLAAQRQSVNAEMPNVNFFVYGYLDKKALTANEQEKDLLAGFYFYLQECGYLSNAHLAAQRAVAVDDARALQALDVISHALDCYTQGGVFPKGDCHDTGHMVKTLRAHLAALSSQSVPVEVVEKMAGKVRHVAAYLQNYCIVVHPKQTTDGEEPEQVMLRHLDEVLALAAPYVKGGGE